MKPVFLRLVLFLSLLLTPFASVAQDGAVIPDPSQPQIEDPSAGGRGPQPDRSATGGAQTLEDILARQNNQRIDDSFRRNATGDPDGAAATIDQLGTLGGVSDSEVYRAIRYGTADVTVSNTGPASAVLIQDGGMRWLKFRKGPLLTYGGYLLLGTLALLLVFYLLRGRIRIDGEKTGRKIERFKAFERFGHWLIAGSFLLLGITGLLSLAGRKFLIPLFGKDSFAAVAVVAKWIHNNVAWAFMLGLIWVSVTWISHNIPNRHDLKWLAMGGGMFSKNAHPPAKKFNAGQKIVYWSCVVLGLSISISGLSLLFPFELPMFAKTFTLINQTPVLGWLGLDPLPSTLAPHEEMQLAQLWHSIIAFIFMAIILAHIYLGTVGMEGAFDAMGTGMVEEQWAREHHNLWVDELEAEAAAKPHKATTPAE